MFPNQTRPVSVAIRFPRVRGDVPGMVGRKTVTVMFSPRARGCSPYWQARVRFNLVFPACAGMFLARRGFRLHLLCFPRVRGDVPS